MRHLARCYPHAFPGLRAHTSPRRVNGSALPSFRFCQSRSLDSFNLDFCFGHSTAIPPCTSASPQAPPNRSPSSSLSLSQSISLPPLPYPIPSSTHLHLPFLTDNSSKTSYTTPSRHPKTTAVPPQSVPLATDSAADPGTAAP
jgi:hypothetical protein